ncbi:HEAT repeat domain-containing protein [Methanofollis ethanolicus]|uniref:HEAT repeat domain-containing protein n=1 Tax=Methanofollis ethanolicus TaxID=488124 RepID=UPI00082B615B|nr:HEAT repeat domain-containing protein [Methanofollis ethanolicus]
MDNSAGPEFSDDTLPVEIDVVPSPEVLECAVDNDLDSLTALLFHGESQKVREDAALAIGMLMGEEAVGAFIGLFAEDDRDLRMAASWGLSAIGTPAIDGLIAALSAADAATRMWAAYTLGAIGHCKAEVALGKVLKDDDADVRWWASWALDQILQRHGCCNGC